jgi:hypothetical protein
VLTKRRPLGLVLGVALAAAGIASFPAPAAAAGPADCARADHTVAVGGSDASVTTHVEWCWSGDLSTVTRIGTYAPTEPQVAPTAPFTATLRDDATSIAAGAGRHLVSVVLQYPLRTCLAVVEGTYLPGGRSEAHLRTPMICLL